MVDDLDVALLRVVDAREVREAVEAERRIRLRERRDVPDAGGIDRRRRVHARALERPHDVAELLAESGMDAGGVELHQARTPTGSVLRTIQRSFWIFSWSFTRPSVSASGRGGQPGT